MISFRYHVVTIVAVFVALAVGMLMGSTFLDQGLVNDLQNRTADLAGKVSTLQDEVKTGQTTVGVLTSFMADAKPMLVGGRLNGMRVVVVTEQGVDLSNLSGVRQTLAGTGGAGATIDGVVTLSQKLSLKDQDTRAKVAELLGRPPTDTAQRLSDALARALAARLASGAPAEAGAPDLLVALEDAGLLTISDAREGPSAIGGAGAAVTILSGTVLPGTTDTPVVSPEFFYVPFIQGLVTTGTNTAATEPSTTTSPFLDVVRADSQIEGKIVTVDDIEWAPGQVALVWGLEDLASGQGGGDYGLNCGSCSLVPSPSASP